MTRLSPSLLWLFASREGSPTLSSSPIGGSLASRQGPSETRRSHLVSEQKRSQAVPSNLEFSSLSGCSPDWTAFHVLGRNLLKRGPFVKLFCALEPAARALRSRVKTVRNRGAQLASVLGFVLLQPFSQCSPEWSDTHRLGHILLIRGPIEKVFCALESADRALRI